MIPAQKKVNYYKKISFSLRRKECDEREETLGLFEIRADC